MPDQVREVGTYVYELAEALRNALDALGIVIGFLLMPGAADASTTASLLASALSWLVGLAVVILLWNRQSGAYFKPVVMAPPYPGQYPQQFGG
ncbi:hypothetical protein [Nocardia acididurans]|uniref:hypothetical protein n=1 Tax=Nocardia acididurans TaxID=2802282 RepID=UPI0027DAF506|nr:hypothetical protein [Nocardia acididurans]